MLMRIEATRVAARRGNFGAGIGGAQRAGLILRAVNAIREIAGAKRRNRTLDHAHVHLLQFIRKRAAESVMQIGEDRDGGARRIAPIDGASSGGLGSIGRVRGRERWGEYG